MSKVLARNSTIVKTLMIISVLIVVFTTVLSWWLLSDSWHHYYKANKNAMEFKDFYHVLLASNNLANERAQANELILASSKNKKFAEVSYRESVKMTNETLSSIPQDIMPPMLMKKMFRHLNLARHKIHTYYTKDKSDPVTLHDAITSMMLTTNFYHHAVFMKTNKFVQMESIELGTVLRAQAIGELRDTAGRLGSIMLLPLYTRRELKIPELEALTRGLEYMRIQWMLLAIPGEETRNSEAFKQLLQQTHSNYERQGSSLIRVLKSQSDDNKPYILDAEHFARRYHASLFRFNDLLHLYLSQLDQHYSQKKKAALTHLFQVLAILLAVYILAISIVIYIRCRVVKPLLSLNLQAQSISDRHIASEEELCEIKTLQTTLSELGHQIDEQKAMTNQLRLQSEQDALTKILNRRGFEKAAQRLLTVASCDSPAWLIAIDIDHFKTINDTWGHPVGDLVLAKLGETLKEAVRPDTLVARLGGEEFAVMLTSKNKRDVYQLTLRIQQKIRQMEVVYDGDATINITASFGVACGYHGSLVALLSEADKALYHSKKTGRDRFTGISDGKRMR